MKTFLWTTLFWIIVVIALLLCLGFGNLGTQVLDNEWMSKFLPHNVQTKVCEPIVTSALEEIDWCAAAETNSCCPVIEENEVEPESMEVSIEDSLQNILTNQQVIYNYLQESFANTNQTINNLSVNISQGEEEPVIDEKQQQRLQLQAQIEALQNEMANL